MSERIVCGVDGSVPARAAARLSAALADRLGLDLLLLHAVPGDAGRRAGAALLARLQAEIGAPDARLWVDAGPAAECLADAGHGAALVAIGGGGALKGLLYGSVRGALARRAPCPVAVVPPSPQLGGRRVVCGIRDVADAPTAVHAGRLADALGLPLTLVHVLAPAAPAATALVLDRPGDEGAARRLLRDMAAVATDGRPPSLEVVQGPAGRELARLAVARAAALVVVGAPRQGPVAAALAGSASSFLLRRSTRPVVTSPVLARQLT